MSTPKKKAPSKTERRIVKARKILNSKENRFRCSVNLHSDELEIIREISPDIYEVFFNLYALGFAKGMKFAEMNGK